MSQKTPPIRLDKLRKAAKGQMCMVNSPVCNHSPETSRLIHYRSHDDGAGMGLKPNDSSATIACSECDTWLGEGNRKPKLYSNPTDWFNYYERQERWFRAMRRFWEYLLREGILK